MKKTIFIIVCLSCFTFLTAQKRIEKSSSNLLSEQVEKGNYQIDINRASTTAISKNLTENYSLVVKNDSVFATLPYIDRKSLSIDETIELKAPIENYSVKHVKDRYQVHFKTNCQNENFTITVRANEKGESHISLNSTTRPGMTYNGIIHY